MTLYRCPPGEQAWHTPYQLPLVPITAATWPLIPQARCHWCGEWVTHPVVCPQYERMHERELVTWCLVRCGECTAWYAWTAHAKEEG